MDINFELYKVFYHVAQTLSFSEASSKLFISQSAVSQSIKLLEEKMGCKLLFRNTKQVSLTYEGEVLYRYIEQAFNLIKSGERSIAEMNSLLQGEVRIAASDTICKYYLLPYFKKYNRLYPGIKIHVTNRTSQKCTELLKKGQVDFSIVNILPKENVPDLHIKNIKPVHDIFVAGPPFEHLKDRCITLYELSSYPIIMLEKSAVTRKYFDNFLKEHNLSIIPEIELGSIDLLVELAKIGLGISFVIEECAQEGLKDNSLFKVNIEEKLPERYLAVAWNKKVPLSRAAKKFIELLAN